MQLKTTLHINDQVNVKFEGLDPSVRRKMVEKSKYFLPYARHTPLFKMGRWDGNVSFCSVGANTFIHMLDDLLPIVLDAGYEVDIEDHRPDIDFDFEEVTEDTLSMFTWPEGHRLAGEPIVLEDHQIRAANTYFENTQSIQCLSTGAGKTILSALLSMKTEKYGKSIVIVPSKSLVEQTEEDYKNLNLDVGVFYGDRKDFDKTHIICTWQSLAILSKKTKRNEVPLELQTIHEFLRGVATVIVDECHSAGAQELKDLLTGPMSHVPIRWGMTGTIPKEEFNAKTLFCSIGEVVGEVTASELQEKGFLSNCEINILQLQDKKHDMRTYAEEINYLCYDQDRINKVSELCNKIALNGNMLILVEKIETGNMLKELMPDSVFIQGKVKTKDRKKEYKEVHTADNKVIIATYGVAAVGINIPRIFNLVLFEAGKSFVRVIQSIGRGIRKADDKDFVNVYDICSSMKYSKRHLTKRKEYYDGANYPHTVTKIKY